MVFCCTHMGCRFDVKFNIVLNCPIHYEQPFCKLDFILLQTKKVVEIWVCFEVQFQLMCFLQWRESFKFSKFKCVFSTVNFNNPDNVLTSSCTFHVLASDWEVSRVCGTCQCHIMNKPSLWAPQCPPVSLKQLSMIPDRAAYCWYNKTFIYVAFFLDTLVLILHRLIQPPRPK